MATLTRVAFWFLRHGETDWNARGLSQGHTDIPLNATGIAQAHAAAPLLRNRGITAIVSSPLSRAYDTAVIAGEVLGLPVEIDDDLREVGFGAKEGQPQTEWFADWVVGSFLPEGGDVPGLALAGGGGGQSGAGATAGGPRGRARRAVSRAAGGDGAGSQCPHAERDAVLLRAGHAGMDADADHRMI